MNTPYTKTVATRIAQAGAKKMDAQGYTIEQGTFQPVTFLVHRPNQKGFYLVQPGHVEDGCDCVFFQENGICKHSVRVDQHIEEEAWKREQANAAPDEWDFEEWAEMQIEAGMRN